MTRIDGSVAVVTGGGSGIGQGIVEEFAARGARVVVADIDLERAQAVAAGVDGLAVRVDVAEPDSVSELARLTMEHFGQVDIVVNNAGVGPAAPIVDLSLDDWRWITQVNYFGVVHGVHTFIPLLQSNPRGGHIVNTISMAVFLPLTGLAPIVAAKMASYGLSQVLDLELREAGSDVRVTVVPAGPVRTNIRDSMRHRPPGQTGALTDVDLEESPEALALRWISPGEAGRVVARAVENDDFLALTHPEWWPRVAEKFDLVRNEFSRYPAGEQAAQ